MAFSMFYLVCVLVSLSVYRVETFAQEGWKNKVGVTLNFKELSKLETWSSNNSSDEIPQEFDLRNERPACKKLISLIRDQGSCASEWAVVPASVFSDTLCIASNGTFHQALSAEDLIRCCDTCKKRKSNGCEGGNLVEPLNYMKDVGVVSGGEYGSGQGCLPYSLAPGTNVTKTNSCRKQCTNPFYKKTYNQDKHRIKKSHVLPYDVTKIKNYLMTKGSCLVGMKAYDDFKDYKSGIYKHETGKFVGNHVVRLIGWGVEDGVEYWLAANSWGTSWGIQGTFKINIKENGSDFGMFVGGVDV